MNSDLNKKMQQYQTAAIQAAEAGDWPAAVKLARLTPGSWNTFDQLAALGVPPEHLDHVLDHVPAKSQDGFLFELANNLHPDLTQPQLQRIAKMGLEDYMVQENTQRHPNWAPGQDLMGEKAATEFWRSYERKVHPFHMAAVKSLFTGQPEQLIDHRGGAGDSHGHYIAEGFVYNLKDSPTVQSWPEPHKKYGGVDHFKPEGILKNLTPHAQKVQQKVMEDETIPKRYFNGKPYIKLYRGVAGEYATKLREATNYDPEANTAHHKKINVPTAHLTSWTTDPDMARSFATTRGYQLDKEGAKGTGVVISAWHPIDSILHSGFHTVTPGQQHAHPSESEIVVGHKDAKFQTKTSNLEFLRPDATFAAPKVVLPEPKPKAAKSLAITPQPSQGLEKAYTPNNSIRQIADLYAKKNNLSLQHDMPVAEVKPERAKKIAAAFEAATHAPHHPDVKAAYGALIHETGKQLAHMISHGVKFSKIEPHMKNPYPGGSKDLFNDVNKNNHMWYFPTDSGFGTEDKNYSDHPLLQPVYVEGHGHITANDAFRLVHDYFGHAKEGFGFGPKGEENAWQHHMQMFSPLAQKALTAETRMQNSTVNFGSNAEHNKKNPEKTIYADQKATLAPDWAMEV